MIVLRPYDAEDNEINMEMRRVIEEYSKKNNEIITIIEIFESKVHVKKESGREPVKDNIFELQKPMDVWQTLMIKEIIFI